MTARWGPMGWITLHSISANYPETPSQDDKLILKKYLGHFSETIACPSCKTHFGIMYQTYMNRNPQWADSRKELFLFICRAHNTVNTRLDKPKMHSVQESIDALQALTRITSPAEYRKQYLVYLQRNWSQPNPEGFMMSAAVREMIKINNEYWNPRETNFDIKLPEDDVLQYISPIKAPNGRTLPGLTSSGAPVKVGFSMKAGRFSLIGR